jgi:hypothetical protein
MMAAACFAGGTAAFGQTFAVDRIDNPALALGNMVSAPTGDTVFRIDPDTGEVTRLSGTGTRMSAAAARAMITVRCSKGGKALLCNSERASVQIGAVGSATGRARSLANLTVAAGTAAVSAPKKGGNPLHFTLGPLGEGGSATFYVGADFAIAGDNSGLPTGTSAAEFYVTISRADGSGASTASGIAQALVRRPITLTAVSDLRFGAVTLPSSGTGRVIISPADGTRSVEGTGVRMLPSQSGAARFTVSGEGGQAFSVTVPSTFEMKTNGGSITVTTAHNAGSARTLAGKAGSAGTAAFNVGGSFPLAPGTRAGVYAGTFEVSVQYN